MISVGYNQAVPERSSNNGVHTCGCGKGKGKEHVVVESLLLRLVSQGVLL